MKRTHLFLCLLLCAGMNAQDSLHKTQLKLFDANLLVGFTGANTPSVDMAYISSTTQNKVYTDENFTKGFYDTSVYRRRHGFSTPGVYSQAGISGKLQFANTRSGLLKRIKPRFGIYFSSQKLYQQELGYYSKITIDSLHYTNSAYPPIAIDSVSYGALYYTYRRRTAHFELGANIDLIVTRRMIVYAGLLYSFGVSYDNKFMVFKEENYYIDRADREYGQTSQIIKTFQEPGYYISRFLLPIGIQHRFAVMHRFSVSFFGEMRTGLEADKIRNAGSGLRGIFMINFGVRFNFRYHK